MRQFMRNSSQRLGGFLGEILDFLKAWNVLFLALALILLWGPFQTLVYWYDPQAGPLDIGVAFKGYLGAVYYTLGNLLVWLHLKLFGPIMYRFWQGLDPEHANFKSAFTGLESKWKIGFLFAYLFIQFLFAALCLLAANNAQ